MKIEATLEHKKTGYVQYKIKFTTCNGTQGVAIVGLDGWDYDQGENRNNYANRQWHRSTKGNHVRLSMNGPCWLTLNEWAELSQKINLCYSDLNQNYQGSKDVDR